MIKLYFEVPDNNHFKRIQHFLEKRHNIVCVETIDDADIICYFPQEWSMDAPILKGDKPLILGGGFIPEKDLKNLTKKRPVYYQSLTKFDRDILQTNIDQWIKELPQHTQWHIYEACGENTAISSYRDVVAKMITDHTNGRYHEKPYGPKGEINDGDVTSTYEESERFIHELVVTAFTGSKKYSVGVKVSDETDIADHLANIIKNI